MTNSAIELKFNEINCVSGGKYYITGWLFPTVKYTAIGKDKDSPKALGLFIGTAIISNLLIALHMFLNTIIASCVSQSPTDKIR